MSGPAHAAGRTDVGRRIERGATRAATLQQPEVRVACHRALHRHSPAVWGHLALRKTAIRLADRAQRLARPIEPRQSGQDLEQHGTTRPDVRAPIDDLASRLLGAHVGRSAKHHPGLRHRQRAAP